MKLDIAKLDDFWLRREWPQDFDGKIFLARALISFGEARFSAWTFENYRLARIIMNAALLGGLNLARAPTAALIAEAISGIGEEALADDEKAKERGRLLSQFADIKRQFAASLASGEVPSFTRERKGGTFMQCPREHWFTENYDARFERCEISLGEPYSDDTTGDDFRYIYVDGAALSKLTSRLDIDVNSGPVIVRAAVAKKLQEMFLADQDYILRKADFWASIKKAYEKCSAREFENIWKNVAVGEHARRSSKGRRPD